MRFILCPGKGLSVVGYAVEGDDDRFRHRPVELSCDQNPSRHDEKNVSRALVVVLTTLCLVIQRLDHWTCYEQKVLEIGF